MISELTLALALTTSPLSAGTGWELDSIAYYLDQRGWSIQFYDEFSRSKLSPYMKLTAAELERHTGVDFYVGTTINRNDNICPGFTSTGRHRIIVKLDPNRDRSGASVCGQGGSAHSGRATFSYNNWLYKKRNNSPEAYKRNVSSHELGHAIGLDHPNDPSLPYTDPLMAGEYWGGYSSWSSAHKFTPYDINGLKQLVLNRP